MTTSVMALYVFSDAHLGADDDATEQRKLTKTRSLLELVRTDGERLIILGDLFDFWFEYRYAIPKDHHRVICWLTNLAETGVAIDYVSGNHDFWMDTFFREEVGATVHRDWLDTEFGGRRLHLIHGDGLARADRGYRFLKRIFRNRFNIWLYRKLPADWAIPLARRVSRSSRHHTSGRDQSFVADYDAYASDKLKGEWDIVIIGHLHIPTIKEFAGGVYVNTGDFIEHFSYARVTEEGVTLEYL